MKKVFLTLALICSSAFAEFGGSTPPQTSNLGATGQALVWQGANLIPAWGVVGTAGGGTGLATPGSSGNALVSNGTNWASVAVSGDATMIGTGAVTLNADVDVDRNYIMNPNGVIAQRPAATQAGGTLLNSTQVYGGCDRWKGAITATTLTAGAYGQQQTSSPGVSNTMYSVGFTNITTTGTTAVYWRQFIDSNHANGLANQHASLYFNIYQDTGSTQTVSINYYYCNTTDTFQTSGTPAYTGMTQIGTTHTVSGITTGTTIGVSDADINAGLMPVGASFNTGVNAGLMVEISLQGMSAVTTKNFYISDVCLVRGTVARRPHFRAYQQELALCQRYCWVSSGVTINTIIGVGECTGATTTDIFVPFPVPMRTAPTLSFAGTIGHLTTGQSTNTVAVTTNPPTFADLAASVNGAFMKCTGSTGAFTANNAAITYWNASATSSDKLIFDCDF